MSFAVVFEQQNQPYLLMHPDGKFLAFKTVEDAATYMTMIATKNAEVNGPLSALMFIHEIDMGLINLPEDVNDIKKHLMDFDEEKSTGSLYRFGVSGVKMHGLRLNESIKELRYEPKEEKPKSTRRKFNPKTQETPKDLKPETPKASSDSEDPYSERN